MKKKIPCIVLARKNSKGIKNKNRINLNGKPLIQHTIDHLKKVKLIEHKFENNKNNPLVSNNNLILMSGSFSKYLFGVQKLKII